jgi:hypothetical protein
MFLDSSLGYSCYVNLYIPDTVGGFWGALWDGPGHQIDKTNCVPSLIESRERGELRYLIPERVTKQVTEPRIQGVHLGTQYPRRGEGNPALKASYGALFGAGISGASEVSHILPENHTVYHFLPQFSISDLGPDS